jgi:hypothetical protein
VSQDPAVASGSSSAHLAELLLGLGAAILAPIALLVPIGPSLSKPFWFDEQWRAYYFAYTGNWWRALTADNAPFAAGWYFLERGVAIAFGGSELALRLATAGWWPILSGLLFLLASRFMRPRLAVTVALLGSLTPGLLPYVVQLKPFVVDSAAAVAAVYFFVLAHSPNLEGRAHGHALRLLAYLGVAAAGLFSVAAVLVAGPLLLVDAALALAQRDLGGRLLGAVAAGLVDLTGLGVFVLRQNALTRSPYWASQFMPHGPVASQVAFILNGLAGFLANPFAPDAAVVGGASALPGHLSPLAVVWTLALVIGIWAASRDPDGRWLLLAVLGSLLVALGASYFRYWPFGFVRPNLFELPLLALLAGIGAARCAREAAGAARRLFRPSVPELESGQTRLLGLGAGAVLCALAAGAAVAVTHEATAYSALTDNQQALGYGAAIPQAVALVRRSAPPNTAVIVAGSMAIPGWGFYLFEYHGAGLGVGRPISRDHVLFVADQGSARITAFLDRVRPSELYLYVPIGTTGWELSQDLGRAASAGYCGSPRQFPIPASGLLTLVKPSERCGTG